MDSCELLEKADRKLHESRSTNPLCPINKIFPKQKQTKYRLRNSSAIRPKVTTDRFKNAFINRLIFKYNVQIQCLIHLNVLYINLFFLYSSVFIITFDVLCALLTFFRYCCDCNLRYVILSKENRNYYYYYYYYYYFVLFVVSQLPFYRLYANYD